jgi:hypothetical protein
MGQDLAKLHGNERVDLGDFEFIADAAWQDAHRQLPEQFLVDPAKTRTFIIDGFETTNPIAEQVQVAKGRALLSIRENGVVKRTILTSEGDATKTIDASTFANGTYGVYIRFEYVEGASESRIFWNPAGAGSEFAQTVATKRLANWSMRAELASPGTEWEKVAEFVVTGGTITAGPTDYRNLYFEGEVNGGYPNRWSTDSGGTANDRNSDRAQYGVKDLNTFTRAMRQCLEDIKGRGLRKWYERDIGGMNIGFDANPISGRLAVGDANHYLGLSAGDPHWNVDSGNDYIAYVRSSNQFVWIVGGATFAYLDSAGLQLTNRGLVVGHTGAPVNDVVSVGDAAFRMRWVSSNVAQLEFDANDYISYARSTNEMDFWVAGAAHVRMKSTGQNVSPGMFVGNLTTAPIANALHVVDNNFGLDFSGSNPLLRFDAGGAIDFVRADDRYNFYCNSVIEMRVDTSGVRVPKGLVVGFDAAPTNDAAAIGDANFVLEYNATTPQIRFDAGDAIQYSRTGNEWSWLIGSATYLQLNATRMLLDGYYDGDNIGQNHLTLATGSIPSGTDGRIYANDATKQPLVYTHTKYKPLLVQNHEITARETETSAGSPFATSAYSIPANSLRVGSTIRCRAHGFLDVTAGSGNVSVKITLGGTQIAVVNTNTGADGGWVIDAAVMVRTLGASGGIGGTSMGGFSQDSNLEIQSISPASIDTTSANTLQVEVGVLGPTANVHLDYFSVDIT